MILIHENIFFSLQIIRMRSNFLQPSSKYSKLVDDDTRHSLPISQMVIYYFHEIFQKFQNIICLFLLYTKYGNLFSLEMYEEFSNPLEILAWDGSLLDNV